MPYKDSVKARTYAREYKRERRKTHPDVYDRVKSNERQQRYRAKMRAFRDTLKDKPCADCGVKYPPYVMQFEHHNGNKHFNIGYAISQGVAKDKILAEVANTEIVCANCHAERTHLRQTNTSLR